MFARPKEILKEQRSQQQSTYHGNRHTQQSQQLTDYSPNKHPLEQSNFSNRFDRLEDVVNKLTNQYDALMPLLNLVENAPLLIKKENLIASLQKKLIVTEERSIESQKGLAQVFQTVDTIKQDIQAQFDNHIRSFENKFHTLESRLNDQIRQIQNNEQRISKQVFKIEGKQREELQISMKKYDQRYSELSNDMKLLSQDIQERIQALDAERQKLRRSTIRKDSNINPSKFAVMGQVEEQIQKKFGAMQSQMQRQIDNLQMDVGILECDFELEKRLEHTSKLAEQTKLLPKDLSNDNKMIRINKSEIQLHLDQLEKFNVENTQRIVYELKNSDETMTHYSEIAKQYTANYQANSKEVDKLENKISTLRGQIEGTNKKSQILIEKIEEKFRKLETLQEKQQNGSIRNSIAKDNVSQDDIENRINKLKTSIDSNLNLLYDTLQTVQDKLQKYQTQKNNYMHQYSYMQSEVTQNNDSLIKSERNKINNSYNRGASRGNIKDSFVKRSYVNEDSYQ
ncbi:hypothetical protein PPERSA_10165 [Pseudocohnilembus persalinus]|uniref:Uncharacterized protein n=1 Tax=Pseudocohnilembus persalinus TaxID=266149 RepID=A0A0V0QLR6_PSEPJ|nr:hypothetical protein PPERSA_10165 [Pseudocohnilembus persalinus]|eukprot:KRX03084.1 hypothetical protein PPERSA_10165 [Pseudocohnilembus persalinus]